MNALPKAFNDNPSEPSVFQKDGQVMTNSRDVAAYFGKLHKDVLRAIDKLDCSNDFTALNFEVSEYVDPTGRTLRSFDMTKDGFTFLVMGFTGKKAANFKEQYIALFNAMEATLRAAPTDPHRHLNDPNALRGLLLTYTEKVLALESQLEEAQPKLDGFDRIAQADGTMCITNAAKVLQMRPKDLFAWLAQNGWTYKRPGSATWLGYQSKTAQGLLEHKTTTVWRADGSEKVTEQVRITAKGLTRLATLIKPALKAVS